jgi:hypothetical protein
MSKRFLSCLLLSLLFMSLLIFVFEYHASTSNAAIPGDINGDGVVNVLDLRILADAFGSKPGDPRWNSKADLNGDGKIDLSDLAILATHYGRTDAGVGQVLAGWRSSPYGLQTQVESSYWVNVANDLASKIENSVPGGVWVLGEIVGNDCHLTFNSSLLYPNIIFSDTDENEKYFDAFDAAGLKVWLQVEPGSANVSTLISLVLQRYQHHSCVIGFGIDVEWLQSGQYQDGRAVTNEEARSWLKEVQSYNSSYQLFLKHWLIEKMPTIHPVGLVFFDDSQDFPNMAALADEFNQWATHFQYSNVCFQIGYDSDRAWWSRLADPYKTIADTLLGQNSNCNGVYWVDFTLQTLYP